MLRAAAAMAMLSLGCLAAALYTVPRGPPERATAALAAPPPSHTRQDAIAARDRARAELRRVGVRIPS